MYEKSIGKNKKHIEIILNYCDFCNYNCNDFYIFDIFFS